MVFPTPANMDLTPLVLLKWLLFAIAMAATTTAFIDLTHFLKSLGQRRNVRLPIRMCIGGALVVVLWKVTGTSDYLGLGISGIARAFQDTNLPVYAFAAKLVFTAVTLGAGFLGGEVTPLFFIGASLGNVLARLLGVPIEIGAGIGLTAVFASASNTPLALSIMAIELLGAHMFPHVVIVCVLTYQRLVHSKSGTRLKTSAAIRDL
jgi:H+/Cl- antiporter ClcA